MSRVNRVVYAVAIWLCAWNSSGAETLITPASVSSATVSTDYYPARNLINNSGLSPMPSLFNYSNHHTVASSSTAWVTADPSPAGGDWFAERNPNPTLTFVLDQTYLLSAMVVWGYHFGIPNNNEAKSFSVTFSTDSGITFNHSISLMHQRTAQNADTLIFSAPHEANVVRLQINDNHYGATGASGGDRVGLGEIKFIGHPTPNPNPNLQTTRGIDFGIVSNNVAPLLHSVIITNAGSLLPLHILSAEVVGTPSSPFTIFRLPEPILAGQTGSIEILFDPADKEGCFSAMLEIRSNDPVKPVISLWVVAGVNSAPISIELPQFSVPDKTFTSNLFVELVCPTLGAAIVYTTDGTLPSRQNGFAYRLPINVQTSLQIRAIAILPGLTSPVVSRSYVRLAPDVQAYSSTLPIMVIENFGRGSIPDKGWTTSYQTGAGLKQVTNQSAFLAIINRNPTNDMAAFSQDPSLTTRIGIRVRGAFSSTWNPKPYGIETWDDADNNADITPLGLPKDCDWILYYPHPNYDRAMIYNTFIWELSAQTGRYGTRFRFVDVFVNEDGGDLTLADRRGVYAFAEKVKRHPERIDFEPLAEDGSTGGWLLSINRMDPEPETGFPALNGAMSPQYFHTAGPNRIQQTPANSPVRGDDIPQQYNAFINFESPNGYRINTQQRAAIENWFREFEDALYDDNRWRDPALGYRRYLDTVDFIDYFHLLNLARQSDGLLLSVFPWVSSGNRKLHMGPMWDFNNSVYDLAGNPESILYFRQDQLWYPRLFKDPGFLREYIDRWFALRRGPLANTNLEAIINRQSTEITPALAVAQGIPSATDWASRLSAMKSWLVKRANWLDRQFDQPPKFNAPGGRVPSGFALSILSSVSSNDVVYFTIDGSDPISITNSTSNVQRYIRPLTLTNSVTIRARSQTSAGQWSALNEATFLVGAPPDASSLTLSEIMFNPGAAQADAEFIELLNISQTNILDLSNVRFTRGIDFTFPLGISLSPGSRLVVVLNRNAFLASQGQTNISIAGEFQGGRLDNNGETLRLEDASGRVIQEFNYNAHWPWLTETDGEGYSQVLIAPETHPDPANPANWRSSAQMGGNPGSTDRLNFSGRQDADQNGNGIMDLLDYAFGGTVTGHTSLPIGSVNSNGTFQYTFPHNLAADDLIFQVCVSTDLARWQTAEAFGATQIRTHINPPSLVQETWTLPLQTTGYCFLQVRVSLR